VPVRILAQQFEPNRNQRRVGRQLDALAVRVTDLRFSHEHYALYRRYQAVRHQGGGMDHDSREQYSHFLLQSNVASKLVEFREHGTLKMVSIIDELADGLSSVYTFFEPNDDKRSYGTASILWQLQEAKRRGLAYVYLGYWIRESRKMSYKANFKPSEGLIKGQWAPL
jgi:arginine-tRNA-protein transferase